MSADTLIGKANTDSTWLRGDMEWTDSLFEAVKLDGNTAAMLAERLKQQGIKCHTETVFNATRRVRDDYVIANN